MAAKNKIFFSSIFLLALLALAFNGEKWAKPYFYLPTKSNAKSGISIPHSSELYQEVVHDLVVPWDIAFLEGDLLVTERGGFLQRVGKKRETLPIVDTHQSSEGGLLGITLHPNFEENRWLYLYNSIERQGEIFNQIERYEYKEGKLLNKTIILEGIPGAKYHDGGRMAFGPDGFLYVTTGDADREELAQDLRSLAGKILRLRDDGKFPSDNPFGNAIYSYGHRNSQGLTWDNLGRLWSTEHGPSGDDAGFDELNLIEKGANYGWPIIRGGETREGMKTPLLFSEKGEVWAPASALYFDGSIFFGGLRGEALYEARIDRKPLELIQHFKKEIGRIRTIRLGPDGYFYITTSNRDGRGFPKERDDKVIRIDPKIFRE